MSVTNNKTFIEEKFSLINFTDDNDNKSNTSNPNLVAMANDMLLKGQISKVEYNQLIETQKRYSNSIS